MKKKLILKVYVKSPHSIDTNKVSSVHASNVASVDFPECYCKAVGKPAGNVRIC